MIWITSKKPTKTQRKEKGGIERLSVYVKGGREREGDIQATVLSRSDMSMGYIASDRALSAKDYDNRYL